METEIFQIFWHFDCVQKNPKGSFYELRKGLLHAMCSRIKIKAFLVPKCIKGEKTLKLCRSLVNHFGLRSILKKHSRFVLFVCLWLWRLKATCLSFRRTAREHVPDRSWFLKDYDSSLDPGTYSKVPNKRVECKSSYNSKTILICSSSNCNSCVKRNWLTIYNL